MAYRSLEACLLDLEKHGKLVRVTEEVDPYLEMAAIHLRVHQAKGPALLFENVKGCHYRAASNIFGTIERSKFIFRDTIEQVQRLVRLKNDPVQALKHPLKNFETALAALNAFPLKNSRYRPVLHNRINISDLPLIRHWPKDGGAFITLPQVYTEDHDKSGPIHANLGMYRIQLSGNDFKLNKEIGLHYQIHRGIGVHQSKANTKGQPLKVSIFVGGPPAHTLAAVMPLPEGLSELSFAGVLGGRRFRYSYDEGFCISKDADFVITGEVYANEVKAEGPFGDHLGYYSLQHDFPLMRVKTVYAKKNAIWPFTVVGRPPQEDTSFGALIHEIAGDAIPQEIPGLREVHAVDAAGVHPLLLAVGSERYTPYNAEKRPAELLTIANRVLGTGQLSLAKYLLIAGDERNKLSAHNIPEFFDFILRRINPERDLHFQTNTTIDTLDYSGTGLNSGSKLVIAAYGDERRALCNEVPGVFKDLKGFSRPRIVLPGIIALQAPPFRDYRHTAVEMNELNEQLQSYSKELLDTPLIIVADDSSFLSEKLENFLWVSFTRSNPSHDVHGINSYTEFKHWGCTGPLIIDARLKPHHAPPLETDPKVEDKIDRLFAKGGSLFGLLR